MWMNDTFTIYIVECADNKVTHRFINPWTCGFGVTLTTKVGEHTDGVSLKRDKMRLNSVCGLSMALVDCGLLEDMLQGSWRWWSCCWVVLHVFWRPGLCPGSTSILWRRHPQTQLTLMFRPGRAALPEPLVWLRSWEVVCGPHLNHSLIGGSANCL